MTFRVSGDRRRVQTTFSKPSLTKQSFKEECDINNIVNRLNKNGFIEHVKQGNPVFGDFTQHFGDYHANMNAVLAAQMLFDALPARLRRQFDNDPGALVLWLQDPENVKEAVKLGLATTPATPPSSSPQAAAQPVIAEPVEGKGA